MSDQVQQPASSMPPHWEAIDESLLRYTYGSDQAIYPAPLLTYDRLRSWVDSCPELCIVLRLRGLGHDESQPQVSPSSAVSSSVLGTIIVLPLLNKYWARLIAEQQPETVTHPRDAFLQEHDVDPRQMFPPSDRALGGEEAEVGLHVFHIERFPERFPDFMMEGGKRLGFTELALEEIRSRIGLQFPSWTVVGYSALTVTTEGSKAFKRLGFSPTYTSSNSEGGTIEMMIRKGA